MTTLKTIVAALLLVGGTSLAIAQNGPQTPPATGPKHQCVGIRHGLTECRTIHTSANSKGTSNIAASQPTALHASDTVIQRHRYIVGCAAKGRLE
jgi:hypothetical protein